MKNKIILITGATSGIGKETALALARMGSHIVFTSRDMEKGRQTQSFLKEKSGNDQIEFIQCDLESLDSVRALADEFKRKFKRLDVLINNAGIWETQRKLSKDGIERMFAVNHLAPFLLTNLLLDLLKVSAPSRIVNVSSEAHRQARLDFEDIESEKSFSSLRVYGMSKLMNILFTKELTHRLTGTAVTVNCLHPGVVNTRLFDKMSPLLQSIFRIFMISPEKGARTSVFLASDPALMNISGEYFSNCRIKQSSKESHDIKAAEKLWELSARYVNLPQK